ncbi:MAG: TetR/AcrR family transcriptional regulator C-terminal domain-containing protein [Myxococcaceae bacterium]
MSREKASTRKAPARRAPLNRDRVLRAAVRLADKGGLESVSMRQLAQALGVEAMSLYNHVADKEDLLGGMVDIVVAEIELPAIGTPWKEAMRKRAISAHAVFLGHPWAAMRVVSGFNAGPAMLRYIDTTIGCLHEAGFSYEQADHARNAIDSHIFGFTLQELNFPLKRSEYAETAAEHLPQLPAEEYPYMRALAEQLIQGLYNGVHDFEFGLDLILDGLERRLARKSALER